MVRVVIYAIHVNCMTSMRNAGDVFRRTKKGKGNNDAKGSRLNNCWQDENFLVRLMPWARAIRENTIIANV